jgi:hypothetical protein
MLIARHFRMCKSAGCSCNGHRDLGLHAIGVWQCTCFFKQLLGLCLIRFVTKPVTKLQAPCSKGESVINNASWAWNLVAKNDSDWC